MLGPSSAFWRLNAWDGNVLEREERPGLGLLLLAGNAGPTLIVYGEPGSAIPALVELAGRAVAPAHTLINREVYGALDEPLREHFGPSWGHAWDFFWADQPLAPVEHCERVEFCAAASEEMAEVRGEIRAALLASNPISDAVGELDRLDWFYLRAPDGNIATVMGAERTGGAVGFHGLGTVPDYRGNGYGGAMMVGAVNAALERAQFIRFGVWAWNEGAMRLYTRLGITRDGAIISGRVEPFEELRGT
ncbi:GNAT family N-acetyltransferase [Trueperella sp.]|uniref:GNAT family N-acetyltransferase n=1 Tax=Trueperella sp. TaxID=2699835 RepID=UPI00262FB70A|nr:GNAT family N-acetyltransferase [Trueperella sp.]